MRVGLSVLLLIAVCCAGCGSGVRDGGGVVSLTGEPLAPVSIEADRLAVLESDLASARAALEADPDDEMSWIWVGRRLGYLGRYDEAIEVFSAGLTRFPESFKLLRHRGHRLITTRRLAEAEADLARAASLSAGWVDQLEPDGAPNPAGIPISTTKSNIYYHLGLSRYLQGDFEGALEAYRACEPYSAVNDDNRVSTAYWLALTLRRLGRYDEASAVLAPIDADVTLYENHVYHRLVMLFKAGDVSGASALEGVGGATMAYGVAGYLLSEPSWAVRRAGLARCRALVDGRRDAWAAFGYIAAEAEVARGE